MNATAKPKTAESGEKKKKRSKKRRRVSNYSDAVRESAMEYAEASADAAHRFVSEFVQRERESEDDEGKRVSSYVDNVWETYENLIDDLVEIPRKVWDKYEDVLDEEEEDDEA